MREILFKAKRIDNGEWVEGYYVKQIDGHAIINDETFVPATNQCYTHYEQVAPETVCQFTGLKDKNGKKIFEGDVFKFKDGYDKGVVKFGQYKSSFNHEPKNVGFYIDWERKNGYATLREDLGYWAESDDVEVIGNKYENPELLEVDNG